MTGPDPQQRVRGPRTALSTLAATLLLLLTMGCNEVASTAPPSAGGAGGDPLQRGLEAHRAGRLDDAAAAYREVLARDPLDKWALSNLGLVEQQQGRATSAESYYRLALNVDPDLTMALFNLGLLRSEAGATDEAIQLFRKVLAANPNDARVQFNLGLALAKAGRQAEADAAFAEAKRLDPSLPVPTPSPRP